MRTRDARTGRELSSRRAVERRERPHPRSRLRPRAPQQRRRRSPLYPRTRAGGAAGDGRSSCGVPGAITVPRVPRSREQLRPPATSGAFPAGAASRGGSLRALSFLAVNPAARPGVRAIPTPNHSRHDATAIADDRPRRGPLGVATVNGSERFATALPAISQSSAGTCDESRSPMPQPSRSEHETGHVLILPPGPDTSARRARVQSDAIDMEARSAPRRDAASRAARCPLSLPGACWRVFVPLAWLMAQTRPDCRVPARRGMRTQPPG
jgi:hypothetical protein